MDAWLLILFGVVLIFMTIAKRQIRSIIPILASIIGIILIGFGVKDFINGG
jgi:nicotinamide riboside transporter PnuC